MNTLNTVAIDLGDSGGQEPLVLLTKKTDAQ